MFLVSIYSFQVSSFMYLYHNDALTISFTQIFQTGNQIHQYSTRYSDFYRPHTCRTNIKKFSILFQGPRIWNSLPNNIVNVPTLNIFRRVIKPFLRVRQDAALHIYFFFSKHTYMLKRTSFFSIFKCRLVFKLPVGGNLYSSYTRWLLGDFPAPVTPSKLYANFKFNVK